MTVATARVAEIALDIVADTPIQYDFQLFSVNEMEVIYGNNSLTAVLDADYTITLALDFQSFTITPKASLLTKIQALIDADDTEFNYIVVRRTQAPLTDVDSENVRRSPFLRREVERLIMHVQEINEKIMRTFLFKKRVIGTDPEQKTVEPLVAGKMLAVSDDGTFIEMGPSAQEIFDAEAAAIAAKVIAQEAAADAHTDALAASVDRGVVAAALVTVAADTAIVVADTATVVASAAQVATDKGIVVADTVTVVSLASQVAANTSIVISDTAVVVAEAAQVSADKIITEAARDAAVAAASGVTGGGFTSVNPVTLKLDNDTDDALALQVELDRLAGLVNVTATGRAILKLRSSSGMRLGANVQVSSGVMLDLTECGVTYSANGNIGIQGGLDQLPAANLPILFASIIAGATTFDIVVKTSGGIGNLTPVAGQQFTLSGQQDATGRTIEKEQGYISTATQIGPVTGGIRWTIVPVSPIENSYAIRYTGDDYEVANPGKIDNSNFVINVFSPVTGDTAAGVSSIVVGDASIFAVGDYVVYGDTQNEGDENPSSGTALIHQEQNRIVSINTGTNTITLENTTRHAIRTLYHGGVTRMLPAIGTEVRGAVASYEADGATNRYGLYMKYAVDCVLRDCKVAYSTIAGVNFGCFANHFRLDHTYNCRIINPTAIAKPDDAIFGSGLGYGIVFVSATDCIVEGAITHNCRHSILFQGGSWGNEVFGFVLSGARVSDVDFHGVNCQRNHVHDGTIIGGPLAPDSGTTKTAIRIGNPTHIPGDHNNLVENIAVYGFDFASFSGYGIGLSSPSRGNVVKNIDIYDCTYGVNIGSNTTYANLNLDDNTLENIRVRFASNRAVAVDGGSEIEVTKLKLFGIISDANDTHFHIANVAGLEVHDCEVINSVAHSGEYAFTYDTVTGLYMLNNKANGANKGVKILNSPAAIIINNVFANQLQTEVFKDDTTTGNNNGFIWTGNEYPGTATPLKTLGSSTGGYIRDNINRSEAARLTLNTQTASYTAVLTDANTTLVQMNAAGANNFTIPLNSSVAYTVGDVIEVCQIGAGQTTIVAAGGVTINTAAAGLKLTARYAKAKLVKTATDTWTLEGNLSA